MAPVRMAPADPMPAPPPMGELEARLLLEKGYKLKEPFFQIVHEACKIVFSCISSFGFIMFLATQDDSVVTTAIIVDIIVITIWTIVISVGANRYGCDQLWTGIKYIPPAKGDSDAGDE